MSRLEEHVELRLDGKVALVTGSSSGIGQQIALTYAEAGADVTIIYRSDQVEADATADRVRAVGRRALAVRADVGSEDAIAKMFEAHFETFGKIDVLVNNAGIGASGLIHELATSDFDRVLKTNLYGPFWAIQHAARKMIESGGGGRIINISSVHEEACWEGSAAYCVSKAGLRNLTRTAAIELGRHGITVNDIAPGMIATRGLNQKAFEDSSYRDEAAKLIVARRVGMPDDIANMALFLATEAGSYCTGSTFFVDGGWMLTWPPV